MSTRRRMIPPDGRHRCQSRMLLALECRRAFYLDNRTLPSAFRAAQPWWSAQEWLEAASDLEALADVAEAEAREPQCTYPACGHAFLWCEGKHPPCPITGRRHPAMREGMRQAPESDQGTISEGRGYPTTPEMR
jgi:hypothetical protein